MDIQKKEEKQKQQQDREQTEGQKEKKEQKQETQKNSGIDPSDFLDQEEEELEEGTELENEINSILNNTFLEEIRQIIIDIVTRNKSEEFKKDYDKMTATIFDNITFKNNYIKKINNISDFSKFIILIISVVIVYFVLDKQGKKK
ncbi:MAG: hypothetical protein ACOCRX_03275 [Candidatus Woesearchaeota archaeon]